MMRRSLTMVVGIVALAAVSLPFVADAADQPPAPPTTYFGTAAGAVAGQGVIALVTSGANAIVCGRGDVLTDSVTGGVVYRIDVLPESSKVGCGATGRQVQFYAAPAPGAPGRLGLNLATWQPAGAAVQHNLQLGPPLSERRPLPASARDGLN